jgi:hypothetical protein
MDEVDAGPQEDEQDAEDDDGDGEDLDAAPDRIDDIDEAQGWTSRSGPSLRVFPLRRLPRRCARRSGRETLRERAVVTGVSM